VKALCGCSHVQDGITVGVNESVVASVHWNVTSTNMMVSGPLALYFCAYFLNYLLGAAMSRVK
jgi:hypothetical protein